MDFREHAYRREVFLRFYEFHLRYQSHPGGVYFLIPALRAHYGWSVEQAYWWAFINGCTQHPVTSCVIWEAFPTLPASEAERTRLAEFMNRHWKQLEFDTDRRYWKAKFWESVESYQEIVADGQEVFFSQFAGPDEFENFDRLWQVVRARFYGFGRLSSWSYIEYLRILGLPVQPRHLMLDDIDGSKSHRNGLCKVLGRDDLDWREGPPPYDRLLLDWLTEEAGQLMTDARARQMTLGQHVARDVTLLTLESTLCCYKSWHRENRRYPNVYADMLHDRIRRAEQAWGRPFDLFWDIRRAVLPAHLRLEENAFDVGLRPEKQNWYRTTGEVIMMDRDWACFKNGYSWRVTA